MKRYALALLLLVVCMPGLAMADLSGPVAVSSLGENSGNTYSGFGNFGSGGTAVNIGSNFIYSTDNTPFVVGGPLASGTLNWNGTDVVTLSFDYTLSGTGSNNWIQYGFGWSGNTTITSNGSGHVNQTYDLSQFSGDTLYVQAYADGLNSQANISNITASSTPIPAAVWLFGSGLAGLVGLRRRMQV